MRRVFYSSLLLLAAGCGARTDIGGAPLTKCAGQTLTCVAPNAADACREPSLVAAVCGPDGRLSCPSGSNPYSRADSGGVCRPFQASGVQSVGPWGLSDFASVPTDDGRCLWVADSATLGDGTVARNVAFQPSPTPFGGCPETVMPPTPIVTVASGDDPSILIQIDGGYRLAGKTHILYRVFRTDPTATFGAVEVGGGVGHWDQATERISIPTVTPPFPWGLDLDLGDAFIEAGDDAHAFVWGCSGQFAELLQGCRLARLDATDAVELLSPGGTWLPTTDASQAAVLFGGGTWMASVVPAQSGFRHFYVADFGNVVQTDTATAPTGPWTAGTNLVTCDLPADDDRAFCAGPIVHRELSDPTRPGVLAVTYGVGSSAAMPPGVPDDYWPRLVWVSSSK